MSHVFHRSLRAAPPCALRGEGCYLIDDKGQRYFDASGGAAVSCVGHSHPRVLAAMHRQIDTLQYAHTGFFSSPSAEALADLLATHSPASLQHVFFVSSGSEAMEGALKLARQFHVERGEPSRRHVISRAQSYHGNTLGALAIGGNKARRALYDPILTAAQHVSPCFAYRYQAPGESDAQYVERLATELEEKIQQLGDKTVSAFVAETVVGATAGAVPPVPGYLQAMQSVCRRHGVLLILDEVMCGLGRTGSYHAFTPEHVVPDLVTLAKGLGGGYQPIGAFMASQEMVDVLRQGSGAFQHGHTYVGHPVACAAALAVQQLLHEELLAQIPACSVACEQSLRQALGAHPHVGDIRGRGLLWGVELVQDRASATPFDPALQLHARIKVEAFRRGLLCYPSGGTVDGTIGDHILLAPPYISTPAQLEHMSQLLASVIDSVTRAVLPRTV